MFADPSLVYLDGNSLGRLPVATRQRIAHTLEVEWGGELIGAWDHWIDLPRTVGDRIAPLIGAARGTVVVSDSTTVNFYKLCVAALDARPGRSAIVTDRGNFPTDRYVVEGLAARQRVTTRWIDADPIEGPQPADVAAVLDTDVALVTLSHVSYTSAAVADMAAITRLAHDAGALVLWDLSHSAGAVTVDLTACRADLAVGCTYKYLNGGPGAPAYLYVRAEHQASMRSPIWGWWGQTDMFAMGPLHEPLPDIGRFLAGTPPVLALVAADEGVALVAEAGISAIRAKGMALGELAVALADEWLVPLGARVSSPRDPHRRGNHLAIAHPDGEGLQAAMRGKGVIGDFRRPNLVRLGFSPLATRFTEVFDGLACLRDLLTG
ncbi:MAG: kynureninase [Acidimicrobiaceae bacterium]|nr:kynureninase [Acidimicrobiaceae bacterium]